MTELMDGGARAARPCPDWSHTVTFLLVLLIWGLRLLVWEARRTSLLELKSGAPGWLSP